MEEMNQNMGTNMNAGGMSNMPAGDSMAKMPKGGKGGKGMMIAVVIVIIVAIVAFVMLRKGTGVMTPSDETTSGLQQNDDVTTQLNTQSASDELDAIDADLNATDINSLDK